MDSWLFETILTRCSPRVMLRVIPYNAHLIRRTRVVHFWRNYFGDNVEKIHDTLLELARRVQVGLLLGMYKTFFHDPSLLREAHDIVFDVGKSHPHLLLVHSDDSQNEVNALELIWRTIMMDAPYSEPSTNDVGTWEWLKRNMPSNMLTPVQWTKYYDHRYKLVELELGDAAKSGDRDRYLELYTEEERRLEAKNWTKVFKGTAPLMRKLFIRSMAHVISVDFMTEISDILCKEYLNVTTHGKKILRKMLTLGRFEFVSNVLQTTAITISNNYFFWYYALSSNRDDSLIFYNKMCTIFECEDMLDLGIGVGNLHVLREHLKINPLDLTSLILSYRYLRTEDLLPIIKEFSIDMFEEDLYHEDRQKMYHSGHHQLVAFLDELFSKR